MHVCVYVHLNTYMWMINQLVNKYIKNPHLRAAFSIHPLLVGGNPFSTTSIYALIHFLERNWGVYFSMGGTGKLVEELTKLLERTGVNIKYNLDIKNAYEKNGKIEKIECMNGNSFYADNFIFNGDPPNGAELLANNAIHAGVILGEENKIPNSNEITDLKLVYNNEVVDKWIDKKWPFDMLGKIEWLVKDKAKTNNILKKNDLILTGAYGFPVPINEKKLIEVTSSAFGDVTSTFI